MNFPEDRKLFTMKEFSRACGVSRTTLIRIEESGVLTPCRVDPETGYRYYDAYNASQVGQYLMLQSLGLTRTEISDCYYQREDSREFLRRQREKLSRMQRTLEELEVRSGGLPSLSFSFVDLSEVTCYCVSSVLTSAEDGETFFYRAHEQCISAGYQLNGTEPLFGIFSDDWQVSSPVMDHPHTSTACIPVIPGGHGDPHLVTFPAVHAFSGLAYGDYSMIGTLDARFREEIIARKIRPAGPVRFIGLVAPYTGNHIASEHYCYRIVVPVSGAD